MGRGAPDGRAGQGSRPGRAYGPARGALLPCPPPRSPARVGPDGQPPATGSGVYPKGTQNPNSLVSGDWCRARRSGPGGLFRNMENERLLEPPGPGVQRSWRGRPCMPSGRTRAPGWPCVAAGCVRPGTEGPVSSAQGRAEAGFADSHEERRGLCQRRGRLGLATQGLPGLPQGAQLKGPCPVQPPHLSRPLGSVTRAWLASAILPAAPLK